MNDERRFRRIDGNFEHIYPNYYGAWLVTLVLHLLTGCACVSRFRKHLTKPAS